MVRKLLLYIFKVVIILIYREHTLVCSILMYTNPQNHSAETPTLKISEELSECATCLQSSSLLEIVSNSVNLHIYIFPAAPQLLITCLAKSLSESSYLPANDFPRCVGHVLAVLLIKALIVFIHNTNSLTSTQGISLFILAIDLQFNYFC